MSENVELYKAIQEVMEKVGYIQVTGQMKGQGNYRYASESDLLKAIRPAMLEAGLILIPVEIDDIYDDTYKAPGGTIMNTARCVYTFKLIHVPTGQFELIRARGEGADIGDKSVNKAATGALKYALRQPFLIETGDDPEEDQSVGRKKTTTKGRRTGSRTRKNPTPPKEETPKEEKETSEEKTTSSTKEEKKTTKRKPGRPRKSATPEYDEAAMKRAMTEYSVPERLPTGGQSLGKAMLDPDFGPTVIPYLAGIAKGGDGKDYKDADDFDSAIKNAAKYINDFNPKFKKILDAYEETVN